MRIVVAMSGGVDSSVAAALLAEQGHDVIGVSMQLYDQTEGTRTFGSCCTIDDLHDARRVAAAISIPHYILNFEKQFDEHVAAGASALDDETVGAVVKRAARLVDGPHLVKDDGAHRAQRADEALPVGDAEPEMAGAGSEVGMVQVIGLDPHRDEAAEQRFEHRRSVVDAAQ